MDGISFLNVLIAVISLVILAVPAFILVKTKLIPASSAAILSTIVLYCCSPANILMGFQKTDYNSQIATNMLIVLGLSIVMFSLMLVIACLCLRGSAEPTKIRVARFAAVFPNCGYMGLPFLQVLFSDPALQGEVTIYAATIISVFHAFSWTFGVLVMSGDKRNVSFKKIIFNPCIIAIVLGFILFVTVKTPIVNVAQDGTTLDNILSSLSKSIDFIGDMVTPLAMFVIGTKLANVSLKQLFMDKWAYIAAAVRLVGMSIVVMLLVAFLPIAETVKYALFFLFSMPSATNTAMLAIKYQADGDFASVAVLLATVLSIVTIPLMFLLFQSLM